jgi:hypothetical protein
MVSWLRVYRGFKKVKESPEVKSPSELGGLSHSEAPHWFWIVSTLEIPNFVTLYFSLNPIYKTYESQLVT